MSPHWINFLCAFGIGSCEWLLAMRRTLAVARLEVVMAGALVCAENMLGFWVFSMFIQDRSWWVAGAYSVGASLGTMCVVWRAIRAARSQ